jgi:hypothetical protein
VLDPGISYDRLKTDFVDDDDLLEQLESAKTDLQTHYDVYYAPESGPDDPMSSSPTHPGSQATGSPQKIDFLARYKKTKNTGAVTDELAEYFRLTRSSEPYDDDTDPLQWWYSRRKKMPNLYRLVRNVLCIPGKCTKNSVEVH